LLAFAVFCLNKSLEDYRSQKAWEAETARQTLLAARDLSEASFELLSRHQELALALVDTTTLDAGRQTALAAQNVAANVLLAKCEFAETYLPPPTIFKFRAFQRQVVMADPSRIRLPSEANYLQLVLSAALGGLRDVTRPLVVSLQAGRPVLPRLSSQAAQADTCAPPVAATGNAISVTPTTAVLNGLTTGEVLLSWFDFDSQPDPKFSVQPVGGRGSVNGLKPNTRYYYRLVARNECGFSQGELRSFTTPAQ
jgi:hypothetical protein